MFEPQNTLHGSRFEAHGDSWGWEAGLWFGMGEQIHTGKWDPRTDDVPEDILAQVRYAQEVHGVGLLAYVYPSILNATANFTKQPYQPLDLSDAGQEKWLTEMLL